MSESVVDEKVALNIAEQLNQAWMNHTKHQNEQALPIFEAIVNQEPTHIDANYGLGLTLAALGQKDRARQVFQHAAELVDSQVKQMSPDDEDARFTMLARMIAQKLDTLK